MTIEAMKQALEALESATPKYTRQRADQKTLGGALDYWKLEQHQRLKAITSLRQAIAEAEKHEVSQEPVAWQAMVENETMKEFPIKDMAHDWCVHQKLSGSPYAYWLRPLYTHPQPKREWVGLTEDDWVRIYSHADNSVGRAAELAEEIFKDKNGF